jgi:hypothetical protein
MIRKALKPAPSDAKTKSAAHPEGAKNETKAKAKAKNDAKADIAAAENEAPQAAGEQENAPQQDGAAPETAAPALPEEGPIADLLKTMGKLEDVLVRETEVLQQNDPTAMYEIQKSKTQLAAAYETRVKDLQSDPALLTDLPDESRSALRERMNEFDRKVRRNARAINAARVITEDLLRNTVEIVKKHRRESGGYGASGARQDAREDLSAPITVDKSL